MKTCRYRAIMEKIVDMLWAYKEDENTLISLFIKTLKDVV